MLMRCTILALALSALVASSVFGQGTSPANNPTAASPANNAAPGNSTAPANNAANGSPAAATKNQASPTFGSSRIPSGSRVYVAPMGGFENYVIAGIIKKKVAVTLVSDRDKAEYEIRGAAETEKAGWAKMLFLGSQNSNEQASINLSDVKTGGIVFAYSVNKLNSVHGKQSAGEAIGKHLNEAVGKD